MIDGDTIVVQDEQGSEEHVRFVGVDCLEVSRNDRLRGQATELGLSVSEAELFGVKARVAMEEALRDGTVYLELGDPERGRYGRLRAYVWTSDGTLMNVALLRQGLALPDDYPKKAEYLTRYEEAARLARAEGLGIWQKDGPSVAQEEPPTATPREQPQEVVYRRRPSKRSRQSKSNFVPIILVLAGLGVLVYAWRRG